MIVVDPHGRVTLWNLAAERLLGLTEAEASGQLVWTLRVPVLSRSVLASIRKSLARKLAFRVDDLAYERAGRAPGHARLSAVPLVQDERELGAVLLLEDRTRPAELADDRSEKRQLAGAARRKSSSRA